MKRVISWLLAAVLLLTTAFSFAPPVSADATYIRKIVSVVYDDSGSMDGDKWAYANYAMQTFCGMLNSEDQLYITYMSHAKYNKNYKPESVDLSSGGIQSSVDQIRNHRDTDSTPYRAVEVAYDKLKSVPDDNPNTQYWLVVITDGDFDEIYYKPQSDKKKFLNEKFDAFTQTQMPNGTYPQITFLGIGQVVAPDANASRGLYTYAADNAGQIVDAMGKMADKISGRTRLSGKDIRQLDDQRIQISSTIPLLNVAVFANGADAKVVSVQYSGGGQIPITRQAQISYPRYSDLSGGAFLLGDSQTHIEAGSYTITFDKAVDPQDIVMLLEPALEVRMTVSINDRELSSPAELNYTTEGDKLSASFKIYEMGTDIEIDPSVMPAGTEYQITLAEDGTVVGRSSGKKMSLPQQVLKNVDTQLQVSVTISGFQPISYSVRFTPEKYVEKIEYTVKPSFVGDSKSIKLEQLSSNQDVVLCFEVYADGELITDPYALKALEPVLTLSPQGNGGKTEYTNDGKILFTPNTGSVSTNHTGSQAVTVTCALEDGTQASETYTILIADYQVIPVGTEESICKTQFYNNTKGVSFYITKDGVKLDKASVENGISVLFNASHRQLESHVEVAPDGTITVTPYAKEPWAKSPLGWFGNWWCYFEQSGEDLVVTLSHGYGSANTVIDVTEESLAFRIWNVYVPLILELILLAAIIAYIVRYITKPRFASNGALYVGSISRVRGAGGGHLLSLQEVRLNQYNRFKNLWNPFKELTVCVNGVTITAAKGGRIFCNMGFPWYSDMVRPKKKSVKLETPQDIVQYCQEHDDLLIREIKPTSVMDQQDPVISQDDSVYYCIEADLDYDRLGNKKEEVIISAIVFCYSTVQD